MSDIKRFRFVSPGVFINEIDQSQIPALPARMGPVIIGRATKGPGFRPVVCNSFAEFVETFGRPVPGKATNDMWRNGNTSAPTYGAYAAQAYLRHSSPVTFVRALGSQSPNHSGTSQGQEAGWKTTNAIGNASGGGAYGLFVCNSGSIGVGATAASYINTAGYVNSNADASFTTSVGGLGGTAVSILLDENQNSAVTAAANKITIGTFDGSESDDLAAGYIIDAINGETDARITYASSGNGEAADSLGITAALTAGSTTKITLTTTSRGVAGFTSALASVSGFDMIDETVAFTAGTGDSQAAVTGTLAAVWYLDTGFIELSGAVRAAASETFVTGTSVLIGNVAANEWKALIKNSSGVVQKEASFNFNPKSEKYIRNVFNTNPTLVNSAVHSTTTNYWLGETHERAVDDLALSSSANSSWGVILGLGQGDGATVDNSYDDQTKEAIPSETGWFISQDVVSLEFASTFEPENTERAKKLFKFVSIDGGSEWNHSNLKISLRDIRPAKDLDNWPSFTVEIRDIKDHDKKVNALERYSNCNLNPNSPNYVGRKIGTQEVTFNTTDRRNQLVGDYRNKSKYIRVEVNESEAHSRELIPFGVFGPPKYRLFTVLSGTHAGGGGISTSNDGLGASEHNRFVKAGSSINKRFQGLMGTLASNDAEWAAANNEVYTGPQFDFTASFDFPKVPLRVSASHGGIIDQTKAYFGADVSRNGDTETRFEKSNIDILRTKSHQTTTANLNFSGETSAEYSWVFTLDDIRKDSNGIFAYVSGSRKDETSYTAVNGPNALLTSSAAGINRFTTVLYGGFDGLDIQEREPFSHGSGQALTVGKTETNSYAMYSLHKSMDIVKDPERVECNLMTMPGITNVELTNRLVNVAEERGDTLAIIDIQGDYTPDTESTSTAANRVGDVDQAANALKDREINSSYGCCYYPWVQVVDTFDASMLWVPPSVVALGAMAYSESVKEVWFAPAGFSRGGLTATQAGGLSVTGVNQQLTSKQRDTLYEVGINPIAQFPAEGIVIFGQKTLQSQQSALDRINVRRLLIFLKKEVSRIASTTLFEQNVEVTWNAFRGQVETLLSSVKNRLGLTDYKVILDETTTTPDLIDRNILYAKVFLKPARSIEFIALDFFITRSGASFED